MAEQAHNVFHPMTYFGGQINMDELNLSEKTAIEVGYC
jgi:hypothetical protein